MKTIEVTEADMKQAVIVFKLLQEAKFEIKGDALSMAADAQRWVADMARRLKDAKEVEIIVPEEPKKARK
jgi:hypothetical protein